MNATQPRGDVRGFYAALGVQLPAWAQTEAPVRCFASPDAHAHEDQHPSCSVNLDSGAFNCHGCGAHGGAYDAALALGRSPREAIDLMVIHGLAERRPGRGDRRMPRRRREFAQCRLRRVGPRRRRSRSAANRSANGLGRWPRTMRCWRGCEPSAAGTSRFSVSWMSGSTGSVSRSRSAARTARCKGCCGSRVHASQRPKVLALHGTRLGLIPRPAAAEERCGWWRGRATCSPQGPPACRRSRSPARTRGAPNGPATLRVAAVTVVMDADRPGRDAALRIARDLEQHGAARVRILELAAGRDDGYDLSDWLRQDNRPLVRAHTSEEFRRMLGGARGCGAAPASSSVTRGLAAAPAVRSGRERSH